MMGEFVFYAIGAVAIVFVLFLFGRFASGMNRGGPE